MILYIRTFYVSRIIGDHHEDMRFFVVSRGCRRVNGHVGASTSEKMAIIGTDNFCSNRSIGVLFILTGRHRTPTVFHLVDRVSPRTFIDRDTIVNICNRNFSGVGCGTGGRRKIWSILFLCRWPLSFFFHHVGKILSVPMWRLACY